MGIREASMLLHNKLENAYTGKYSVYWMDSSKIKLGLSVGVTKKILTIIDCRRNYKKI